MAGAAEWCVILEMRRIWFEAIFVGLLRSALVLFHRKFSIVTTREFPSLLHAS